LANPQPHKFTRISNEIMEAVPRFRFNGTQHDILLVIWRHTYGFHRKDHEFSLSFLADAIGASRSQVDRAVTTLIERNVLTVTAGGVGKARVMGFNKDYDSWLDRPPVKRKPPKPAAQSPPKRRGKKPQAYALDSTYYKMAEYFLDKIKEMAANIGFNHASIAKADLQKWADEFRLMVERDKVTDKRLIFDVMNWVTAHDFWRTNVLSAKKLRERFGELALKMKAEKKGKNGKGGGGASQIDRLAAAQEWIEQGGDPYDFNPDA